MRDRVYHTCRGVLTTALLLLIPAALFAQPSPDRLADTMVEKNNGFLSNIDRIEILMEMEGIPMSAFTTLFEKRTEDGFSWLAVASDDPEFDTSLSAGLYDDKAIEMIRSASSVSSENFNGFSTYKLMVDDKELMDSWMELDMDEDLMDMTPERVTIWIDSEMYVPRKVYFEQHDGQGNSLNVEMIMEDYETHSGLPIAHSVHMKIEGLDTQFSEQEIEEARRMMSEMEDQLAQLPEAQRTMIKSQMKPQMERFEQMLNTGEAGGMVMKVTEVVVNP